jgi:hypothetical protein
LPGPFGGCDPYCDVAAAQDLNREARRGRIDLLALDLHHDKLPVLAVSKMAPQAGFPTKTRSRNLLEWPADGKTTGKPDSDTPRARILRHEPRANVERYDSLRARTAGSPNAS